MSSYVVQDAEINRRLGSAASKLTPEERAALRRLLHDYQATQKGRASTPEEDAAAWAAMFEHVTGELDLPARGRAYREAQAAAYAGAIVATLAGMSEVRAARESTLTRRTLRLALGKPS